MRFTKTLAAIGTAAMLATAPAMASPVVFQLTFEGLQNLEAVENFYNGGTGSLGSSGPNLGISFGSNALAIIDSDAPGGTGNFGGEPSPDTVLFFLSGSAVLNYAPGFTTGFSFFYSAINQPGVVNVYDGLDATGNLLATINLPLTPFNGAPDPTGQFSPFVAAGVVFAGTAKSIDFGGTVDQIAFDNITFGTDNPIIDVPAPAALGLFGLGLLGLGLARRRRA
jgi:hypothetical protein